MSHDPLVAKEILENIFLFYTYLPLREPISSQDTSGYTQSRLYNSGYVPTLSEPIFRLLVPISSSGSESWIIVYKKQNFLVEV